MTPDRWQQIKDIFCSASELPDDERAAFLKIACGEDRELLQEVNSLLNVRGPGDAILDHDVKHYVPEGTTAPSPDPWLGRKIGAYELLGCIGRGGMGAVYRARRADAAYEHEVAIKLVRSGFANDLVLRRLRTERQILADLDHPNIARLLDGGATSDGEPYLVLELVQGQPIDSYCATKNLPVAGRISLFREVCAAVSFAHRHLVVHRDLKPSNILVSSNGTVKLLDFGIAKLLQPENRAGAEATRTVLHALTPEFASPEQVLGLGVTTASDVYSLGVLLFHLVCGVGPYASRLESHQDALQAICNTEPLRPSDAAGRSSAVGGRSSINSDLESILLKALRKEPERRYSSVDQFSEDLRRYSENLPVVARADQVRYRALKFWQRHRVGMSAAATAILALLVGLVTTIREFRIADQQREIADHQREIAAKRFNDVRQLAHTFLFDVHDAIRGLPGAAPARDKLVNTGLKYLDALSVDASNDRSMLMELARSYVQLGDIQGEPYDQNEGNPRAAVGSYLKALQLYGAAAKSGVDPTLLAEMAKTRLKRGFILMLLTGDPARAAAESRIAVDLLESRLQRQPEDPAALQDLVSAYEKYARESNYAGDDAAVDRAATRSWSLSMSALQRDPANLQAMQSLSRSYSIRLMPPHQAPSAELAASRIALVGEMLSLDQRIAALQGNAMLGARTIAVDMNQLGIWQILAARYQAAEIAFAQAKAIFERLQLEDRHNSQNLLEYLRINMGLERARIDAGDFGKAQKDLNRLVAQAVELEKSGNSLELQYFHAHFEQQLGSVAMHLADASVSNIARLDRVRSAHEWYARSVRRFAPIAGTAKLDVYDEQPIDRAHAGLQQSEMEIQRLERITSAATKQRPHEHN